jgi:hypothetical protein
VAYARSVSRWPAVCPLQSISTSHLLAEVSQPVSQSVNTTLLPTKHMVHISSE